MIGSPLMDESRNRHLLWRESRLDQRDCGQLFTHRGCSRQRRRHDRLFNARHHREADDAAKHRPVHAVEQSCNCWRSLRPRGVSARGLKRPSPIPSVRRIWESRRSLTGRSADISSTILALTPGNYVATVTADREWRERSKCAISSVHSMTHDDVAGVLQTRCRYC